MEKKPNIGVVGLGRMGQSILKLLKERGDLTFHPFSRLSGDAITQLKQCDVVIEFTTAEAAPDVIKTCISNDVPVVSGTTGWHEYHLESILRFCKQKHGRFLYASNFSIGMNIVFALNAKLANVLAAYPQFKPSVEEIHHIHKKDMPSGTAYTLLEDIMKQQPNYFGINLNKAHGSDEGLIPVVALREGDVKGIHEVKWNSGSEEISIRHESMDRGIFAAGAIIAALWLQHQPNGIYTMRDLIHV
ncbi:MAG TPA: 4-hydroxy-tetrahydrodipicolinate reductase [Saprospiraceae bacterium]|nr:4-hydroxy-tetrahydrodipicolinate reductase [Saprospiraceae bacterium]